MYEPLGVCESRVMSIRRSLAAASLAVALVVPAACGESDPDGGKNTSLEPVQISFTPTCGSPGDAVQVQINTDSCDRASGVSVTFSPRSPDPDELTTFIGPGSRATVSGEAKAYSLALTVPAGAQTGTLAVSGCRNLNQGGPLESTAVFTIPCPPGGPDGGPDGGDAGGPGEPVPLGGVLDVTRSGSTNVFDAVFYGPLAPADAAAAEAEHVYRLLRIDPDVPLGTCGAPSPLPQPPAQPVPGVSVGTVTLTTGGSPAGTFAPQTNAGDTFYQGDLTSSAEGALVDVALEGAGAFPATTIPGALRTAPAIGVVSPPLTGQIVVAPGPFTFTFPASNATHMALVLSPISGGAPTYCAIDPTAGTFTIPAATIGAAGTTFAVSLRNGNIGESKVGGRRYVSVATSSIGFSIKVE